MTTINYAENGYISKFPKLYDGINVSSETVPSEVVRFPRLVIVTNGSSEAGSLKAVKLPRFVSNP